ncbi:flagellar motor protein MotB [Taibaiella sp. KBW10]|uniref:OmpA family protein n=1 Tax=Taibaiella sp. KBW10 TaxID=2153357 RepID=UPI000F5A1720|nr:OmpA family protein [Taibaiella sp. KBW10]RQO30533.1 flagellar motor protein MotB [Taibaiella sp. KBW10]
MKNSTYILFCALALGTVLGNESCVSSKKYKAANASIASLRSQNRELNSNIDNLRDRLQLMESANNSAAQEIQDKESTINAKQSELASKQAEITSQQEKLRTLQELIDRQKTKTDALKNKMAEALKGFSANQLTVSQKNGKVYVSLQESLLFPSGSAVVNAEGKTALSKLAEVLNANPEINIGVEGHTDSIPIRLKFEDNWALSVARATSIVRILIKDYAVDPTRIIASGRSQFFPVAANGNPEGRAQNRRTEIILEPKLDELLNLIESQ